MATVELIEWSDLSKVELRVGKVIGVRTSSVQITELYNPEEFVGRQVVGVGNFPKQQIGPLLSECLITGLHDKDGAVALCIPDKNVPLGAKLC